MHRAFDCRNREQKRKETPVSLNSLPSVSEWMQKSSRIKRQKRQLRLQFKETIRVLIETTDDLTY